MVGDPLDPATALGPLVSDVQRDRVREYIHKGVAEGAKLVAGGPDAPEGLPHGYFVRPTVFSNVTTDMTIAREEIFGPVLAIMPYDDEADAIRIANDSAYGSPAASGRAIPPERSASRGDSGRDRSRSTEPRSIRSLPSAASSSPATARELGKIGFRRVSRDEVDPDVNVSAA